MRLPETPKGRERPIITYDTIRLSADTHHHHGIFLVVPQGAMLMANAIKTNEHTNLTTAGVLRDSMEIRVTGMGFKVLNKICSADKEAILHGRGALLVNELACPSYFPILDFFDGIELGEPTVLSQDTLEYLRFEVRWDKPGFCPESTVDLVLNIYGERIDTV